MNVVVAELAVVQVMVFKALAAKVATERCQIGVLRARQPTQSPRGLEPVPLRTAPRIRLIPASISFPIFGLLVGLAVERELDVVNVTAEATVERDEA
jgi:hypothetical protein